MTSTGAPRGERSDPFPGSGLLHREKIPPFFRAADRPFYGIKDSASTMEEDATDPTEMGNVSIVPAQGCEGFFPGNLNPWSV